MWQCRNTACCEIVRSTECLDACASCVARCDAVTNMQGQHARHGQHSVCFIDVENEVAPSTSSHLPPSDASRGLVWLGPGAQSLAIIRNDSAHIFSLAPCLADSNGDAVSSKGHGLVGSVRAPAFVTAVAPTLGGAALLVAARNSTLSCYSLPCAVAGKAADAGQLQWRATLPSTHDLLASCPATQAVCASASSQAPAIAIWRHPQQPVSGEAASRVPAPDWLKLPCAPTCISFRPSPPQCARRPHTGSGACVLMAACADNCVRLWVDTDLSDALPPGFSVHTNATTGALGRTMCLAHMLSVPGLQPAPQAALVATWAVPPLEDCSGAHARRTSWLVVTRCAASPGIAAPEMHDGGLEPGSADADEVYVWAVTVDHADSDGAAMATRGGEGEANGVAVSVSVSQATHNSAGDGKGRGKSAQLGNVAACRGPKVSAALWGQGSEHVRCRLPFHRRFIADTMRQPSRTHVLRIWRACARIFWRPPMAAEGAHVGAHVARSVQSGMHVTCFFVCVTQTCDTVARCLLLRCCPALCAAHMAWRWQARWQQCCGLVRPAAGHRHTA